MELQNKTMGLGKITQKKPDEKFITNLIGFMQANGVTVDMLTKKHTATPTIKDLATQVQEYGKELNALQHLEVFQFNRRFNSLRARLEIAALPTIESLTEKDITAIDILQIPKVHNECLATLFLFLNTSHTPLAHGTAPTGLDDTESKTLEGLVDTLLSIDPSSIAGFAETTLTVTRAKDLLSSTDEKARKAVYTKFGLQYSKS